MLKGYGEKFSPQDSVWTSLPSTRYLAMQQCSEVKLLRSSDFLNFTYKLSPKNSQLS